MVWNDTVLITRAAVAEASGHVKADPPRLNALDPILASTVLGVFHHISSAAPLAEVRDVLKIFDLN